MKALFWALFTSAIVIATSVLVFFEAKELIQLSVNGKTVIGTVVDYEYSERRGRKGRLRRDYNHKVYYEGYSKWFDLGKNYQLGSLFYVTYSTNSPKISRITLEKSFWKLVKGGSQFGWYGLILVLLIYLVFGYSNYRFFKDFLFPPSKEIKY